MLGSSETERGASSPINTDSRRTLLLLSPDPDPDDVATETAAKALAGSVTDGFDASDTDRDGEAGVRGWAQVRVGTFILCSYFAEVILGNAPGTLLPFIAHDLALDPSDSARLSAVATAAVCVSKLTMGPVVDRVGGKRSALASLILVAVALAGLGLASSSAAVGATWAALAWSNAPMWPAEAVVMKEQLRPSAVDGYFRLLSISSRLGVFSSMGLFAGLLAVMDWRAVCLVMSLFGAVAAVSLAPLIPSSPRPATSSREPQHRQPRHEAGGGGCRGCLWEAVTLLELGWYRWALAAMSGLMMVLNMGYLITTFFADTVDASDSSILLMSMSFPAGILACQVFPAHYYSRRDHHGRRRLCLGLQCVSLAGVTALGLGAAGEANSPAAIAAKVALVFTTTFGLGVAYYIPLHAASVTLAPERAGLCNSSIDGVGYVASILFQVAMSYILKTPVGWRGVWLIAAGCVAFSILAMDRFYAAVRLAEARGARAVGIELEVLPAAASVAKVQPRRGTDDDEGAVPLLQPDPDDSDGY